MNDKYYLNEFRNDGITRLIEWVKSISGEQSTYKKLDDIRSKGFYNGNDKVFLNLLRTQYHERNKSSLGK